MWDERYQEPGFAYGDTPNQFLTHAYLNLPPQGRILCLAEGEGRNAVFLARQGFAVTAVDLSSVGLAKAQHLAQQHGVNITTQVADLSEFELGQQCWDGIVSIWAHLPPALRQRVHRSCVEALRPGGIFVLQAYSPKQLSMPGVGGPPDESMLMDLAQTQQELTPLHWLEAQEVDAEIHEGKYHHGLSATIQLIGKKRLPD